MRLAGTPSLVDGLRLVLGAFLIEDSTRRDPVDLRSIEFPVRDLVGREGAVRFDPAEASAAKGRGGLVTSTSPRSEAIVVLAIALAAIPIAAASLLAIISGDGSGGRWFVAVWATAWAFNAAYRLNAQGRTLHVALAELVARPSEFRVSWTIRRPGALPARRH